MTYDAAMRLPSKLDRWWEKHVRTNKIFLTRREIRRMSAPWPGDEAAEDDSCTYTSEEIRAGLGLPGR
jgi:hypothetical protein